MRAGPAPWTRCFKLSDLFPSRMGEREVLLQDRENVREQALDSPSSQAWQRVANSSSRWDVRSESVCEGQVGGPLATLTWLDLGGRYVSHKLAQKGEAIPKLGGPSLLRTHRTEHSCQDD